MSIDASKFLYKTKKDGGTGEVVIDESDGPNEDAGCKNS